MANNLNNRKRIFTKKIITDEFLNILKNKPLSQITVKEVSTAADINRGTFYYYYEDIYSLYNEIENDFIDEVINYILEKDYDGEEWLETFLKLVKENPDLTIIVLADNNGNNILSRVFNSIREDQLNILSKEGTYPTEDEKELSFQYYAQGAIAVVKSWLTSYPHLSPKEISKILNDLLP